MRGSAKVFVITGLTFVALLLMYYLPVMNVGGAQLRQVDVLADLDPDSTERYDAESITIDEVKKPKGAWKDSVPEGVEPIIDYGTDSTGGMDSFYAALAKGKKLGRPVRVAYLSDSFVEGDIMLVDLRTMLQKHFGNGGLGWLRCRTNFDEGTFAANLSSSGFEPRHIMKARSLSLAHYILPQGYSEVHGTATATVASLSGEQATTWSRATVWGYTDSGATVTGNPTGATVQWRPHKGIQQARFHAANMRRFSTTVKGNAKVFGMSLENDYGIVVDNFGVRGSSGMQLANLAVGLSADFARQHPYDLVIIHYGLNAIAQAGTEKTCSWYVANMKKCVARIRKIYPHSAVMIVSASDMATRSHSTGKVRTMPAVETLVRYQQKMAAEMGVGFINFYDMMGGRNSVVSMAERHLAEKDYVHVNRRGGKMMAEKFTKSFVAGYDNYKRKKAAGY